MNRLLLTNKKVKFSIYFGFYVVMALIGLTLSVINLTKVLFNNEEFKNVIVNVSSGFSFIIISLGFLFFMGHDYLEHGKKGVSKTFKLVGICLLIGLTVIKAIFDFSTGILSFNVFVVGCGPKNVVGMAFSCFSYIYVFIVRGLYKMLVEHYVNEDKKLLIQLLLPFVCFLLTLIFVRLGLVWLLLLGLAYLFINVGSNRSNVAHIREKIKRGKSEQTEDYRNAAFGIREDSNKQKEK